MGREPSPRGRNATAFGNNTIASGQNATAFGSNSDKKPTTASGKNATAFGEGTTAEGKNATAFGKETMASGQNAVAFGEETKSGGKNAITFGYQTTAAGENATAFGLFTAAGGFGTTAFGKYTAAGFKNDDGTFDPIKGMYATAWGEGTVEAPVIASGRAATAFGVSSRTEGNNSLAALGGITEKEAKNAAAIGVGATASLADSIALGSGSVANREAGKPGAVFDEETTLTGPAWNSTHAAIAVGSDAVTRQIIGVAAGSEDTDAVNVAQLREAIEFIGAGSGSGGGMGNLKFAGDDHQTLTKWSGKTLAIQGGAFPDNLSEKNIGVIAEDGALKIKLSKNIEGITSIATESGVKIDEKGIHAGDKKITGVAAGEADTDAVNVGQMHQAIASEVTPLGNRMTRMDNKINKVGAGAAALAALHPMDMDNKFDVAVGFGNYRNANAMALGLFYRPNENVMFSLGSSMGNGENMVNAGVSFALGQGNSVRLSKTAMAKKINDLTDENTAMKEKMAAQDKGIDTLKEALVRLEAKIK